MINSVVKVYSTVRCVKQTSNAHPPSVRASLRSNSVDDVTTPDSGVDMGAGMMLMSLMMLMW